ncbi:hypothetical protein AB6A40_004147 [Gnathostoma spinigerum]|uniref:Uncharacterized protein n=1 Tax=Gnathostoma spinigerum TaxID=75299 RepID=A0ABD6EBM2_9BILA
MASLRIIKGGRRSSVLKEMRALPEGPNKMSFDLIKVKARHVAGKTNQGVCDGDSGGGFSATDNRRRYHLLGVHSFSSVTCWDGTPYDVVSISDHFDRLCKMLGSCF